MTEYSLMTKTNKFKQMKIKEIIQQKYKKTNVLINEEPAHTEICDGPSYISNSNLSTFKTWKVAVDHTKSGKAILCRFFDNKTGNSYFFFRSTCPSKEDVFELFSQIDKIIEKEDYISRIEKSRKKTFDDERVEFSKILNKLESVSKDILSWSSSFTIKKSEENILAVEASKDMQRIAKTLSSIRTSVQTVSRFILEGSKLKADDKVTFDVILGMMSETHARKNKDYGDSFHKLVEKNGLCILATHLEEKVNRISNIILNGNEANNEPIIDSLLDLANYSVMGYEEIVNK